jgi:hypothetical protein
LYLRRVKVGNVYEYILRDSHWERGCYRHRDLFTLGSDPREFIHYPGGNGFYFSSELEEALQQEGTDYSQEELEEVFLPFLDPHIRRVIETFHGKPTPNRWRNCSASELLKLQNELHTFDKRRLHYLRCGRVDIGALDGRPWKFLNVLLGKSRDEMEHVIESMEQQLPPHEVRTYLYTALNLQKYFSSAFTRFHPAALNPEEVDDLFVREICRLNQDKGFFRGLDRSNGKGLHPLLIKYVILYFDNDFERHSGWAEYIRQFTSWRQFHGGIAAKPSISAQEACRCLGIEIGQYEKMDRTQLTRHYRRQAKKLHPDRGGSHEEFIRMTEAYEVLLLKKKVQKS